MGFSSYFGFFWSKSHSNGMRFLGPCMAVQFSPKILGLNVGIFGTVLGSPGLIFWTVIGLCFFFFAKKKMNNMLVVWEIMLIYACSMY